MHGATHTLPSRTSPNLACLGPQLHPLIEPGVSFSYCVLVKQFHLVPLKDMRIEQFPLEFPAFRRALGYHCSCCISLKETSSCLEKKTREKTNRAACFWIRNLKSSGRSQLLEIQVGLALSRPCSSWCLYLLLLLPSPCLAKLQQESYYTEVCLSSRTHQTNVSFNFPALFSFRLPQRLKSFFNRLNATPAR